VTKCKSCSKEDLEEMALRINGILDSHDLDDDTELIDAVLDGDMDNATNIVQDGSEQKGLDDMVAEVSDEIRNGNYDEAKSLIGDISIRKSAFDEIKKYLKSKEKSIGAHWEWFESPN